MHFVYATSADATATTTETSTTQDDQEWEGASIDEKISLSEWDASFDDVLRDLTYMLQSWLQLLYMILWPLLVLAGTAMDNSLVYGEFFGLDRPLWIIWNMSKNFANFALWFFVLFHILKFVFSSTQTEFEIKKILWWALIAWVGIQLSRFVLGALVDVSTIATYGIGGMPLSLLDKTAMWDKIVLEVHTHMKLVDVAKNLENFDSYETYYKYGNTRMAPCETYEWYVLGPVLYSGGKLGEIEFDHDFCVVGMNRVLYLQPYYEWTRTIWEEEYGYDSPNNLDYRRNILEFTIDSAIAGANQQTVDTYLPYIPHLVAKDGSETTPGHEAYILWIDQWESRLRQEEPWGTLLKDIITSWWWFVWPLVALYSSLLDFAQVDVVDYGGSAKGNFRLFMEFALKAAIGLMLIAPLIALALILIVRIGYMWLYIAFSPFIALLGGFKATWADLKADIKPLEFGHVMGVIFAPVLPVLALWLSIIFLQTTLNGFNTRQPSEVWKAFGVEISPWKDAEGNKDMSMTCIDLMWLTEFCYENEWVGTWWTSFTDFFGWLVVNIFAIAVVWFLMFAALKSSSFGKNIADQVEKTGKSVLWSMPVIPIPSSGGGMTTIGAGGFADGLSAVPRQISNKMTTQNTQKANEFVNRAMWSQSLTDANAKNIGKAVDNVASKSTFASQPNVNMDQFYKALFKDQWIKHQAWYTLKDQGFTNKVIDHIDMNAVQNASPWVASWLLNDFDKTISSMVEQKTWGAYEIKEEKYINDLNRYFNTSVGKAYIGSDQASFKPADGKDITVGSGEGAKTYRFDTKTNTLTAAPWWSTKTSPPAWSTATGDSGSPAEEGSSE